MKRPSIPLMAAVATLIVGYETMAWIGRTTRLDADTVAASDLYVIDGDTVALGAEHIRLLEIDAPETYRAHCPHELAVGTAARADLRSIIEGKRVTIRRNDKPDRYGRTLAVLIVDGRDVGAILMADGYALPYKSGFDAHRERTAHWCGSGNW